MSYFTPEELPNNKYHIFGKDGGKNLSEDLKVPFLGEIPLVQSIREAGDVGRPAALQTATPLEEAFEDLTKNVVQELVEMIETQRVYEVSSKSITSVDEMLRFISNNL